MHIDFNDTYALYGKLPNVNIALITIPFIPDIFGVNVLCFSSPSFLNIRISKNSNMNGNIEISITVTNIPISFVLYIAEIIDRIHEKRPKAKIYLESLLPVNRSEDEKINHDTVGRRTNETIQSINEKLESYAEENDIEFINLYDEFTDENGELALKYTEEGLHLSNLGYLRLTNILLPYFQDE